jgi:F-box/leucine-rich repeat protein 4
MFISSRYCLTTLKLACCLFIDDDILQHICLNCSLLQELDIQSCENIIEFLPISNLSNLRKLNLYRTKIKTNDLVGIIHSCEKIEYLNIGSCVEIDNFDWILQQISIYNT